MTSRFNTLLATLTLTWCRCAHGSGFCHLMYINADTNLEKYQVNDMQEVLRIPKDSSFTALMYMDRNDGESSSSTSAMKNLFYSDGQPTTREISTAIYAHLGVPPGHSSNAWIIDDDTHKELDSTSKPTVIDFVRWAWGKCRADQFKMLSFNMHGGGVGGISGDDTSGHTSLSIPELQSIFQTLNNEGKRFNIIGFDTCLMSAYSLMQVLHPLADYLVASEPTEPGYGWDYSKINTRASTPLQYADSIAAAFLAQSNGPNQLVVTDLKKFSAVIAPWKALMNKMKNGVLAGDQNLVDSITRARENSAEYAAVWETFVDWFEIEDSSGAQEKSQMDLGSFWRHLKVQCPALAVDIDALLPKLEAAVIYKKDPYHRNEAVCTGPGCASGAEGIALWFKKRRWMLGAYEHYEKEWGRSKKQVTNQLGPFVDRRIDEEIKYGLPEWYNFLSAFYLFEPKSTSVKTCQGTASGHQSSTHSGQSHNTAPYCPDYEKCTYEKTCHCKAGYNQQQFRTGNGNICYGCVQAPAPAPSACAKQDCSWTKEWSCPGAPRGSAGVASNDGTLGFNCCCGASTSSLPMCPAQSTHRCAKNCGCNPAYLLTELKCDSSGGCLCYACGSQRLRRLNASEDVDEISESVGTLVDALDVPTLNGTVEADELLDSLGPVLDPADVADAESNVSYPRATYICEDDNGFCHITHSRVRDAAMKDYSIKGQIADWVTAVDLYVGTDTTDNTLNDIAWTMALPVSFDSRTTFTARWPLVIPYVVTTVDECQAFMRFDGGVDAFNDPALCATSNVTLQIPVHYFETQAHVDNGTYINAYIQQEVLCSTLQGQSKVYLVVNSPDYTSTRVIDHHKGGFIQPLINKGQTMDFEDAQMMNCNSKAPMPWAAEPAINLMDINGDRLAKNINKVYGVLVSNSPVESDGTGYVERANETFVIDRGGDPMQVTDSAGTYSAGKSSELNWWYIAIPCLACCLLAAIAGLVLYGNKKPKKAAKKTKRAVQAPEPTPTPAPGEAAPLLLPAQPTYMEPIQYVQPVQTRSMQPVVAATTQVVTAAPQVATAMPTSARPMASSFQVAVPMPTYQQAPQPYQQVFRS